MAEEELEAVTNFRRYLRIPSVHPNVNYDECISFLEEQAKSLALPINVHVVRPGKPVAIITLEGKEPHLPSVLLNSHMDVVPVYPEKWKYDPFSAEKDADGNIYARGSQDMKCVGIQYLEAVRRYLKEGLRFRRTIHISFVPDEEIGGTNGMALFVQSEDFKRLNVGLSLDEGVANENEEFLIFYAERAIWQFDVVCPGATGHGSIIHDNTAGEKVRYIVEKFMDMRAEQKRRLQTNPDLSPGDVTTINLTKLSGGVQYNVVPTELTVSFDVRVSIDMDHDEFERKLNKWCCEAGEGVYIRYKSKSEKNAVTDLSDSNIWWKCFRDNLERMGLKYRTMVFPGGTDSRYIRKMGIPAIGFSPMNYTPRLLHDNDEFLNEKTFLRGIDIYFQLIQSLANC